MFKEYFGIRFEFDHAEVDRIIPWMATTLG